MQTTLCSKLDLAQARVLLQCQSGDAFPSDADEWNFGIISAGAIVYESGLISHSDRPEGPHEVETLELDLCRRLASTVNDIMAGVACGMGSEGFETFKPFYIAAKNGEQPLRELTEKAIRCKFADTILPSAVITVEPLLEDGVWWSEVICDGDLKPWKAMIEWFRNKSGLTSLVFIRIGDGQTTEEIPEELWPNNGEIHALGCVFPRLAVGLTPRGSIVGVFGVVVQS